MIITVRLGEPIRRLAGSVLVTLEFPAATVSVAEALARLEDEYPGFAAALTGDVQGHRAPYQIFINARRVLVDEAARVWLVSGDKLAIFLPAIGGQISATPLPGSFYQRPTLTVARDLLGCIVVRILDGQRLAGRISEVEAYIGEEDQASHAARGQTQRNRAMYGPGGLAYVYLIYGMYSCLNVVTETAEFPAAVLIRAIEPVDGVTLMQANRGQRPLRGLLNGPAKLCLALQIDRSFNGHDLATGHDLWLEAGEPVPDSVVRATPRINVSGDEHARTIPWRFVVTRQHLPL